MDANYWQSLQATNRANASVANVVDLNQAGLMPYGGVEVLPAASLELLINQQRLVSASGISFLPYSGGGYGTQVLDGAAIPAQMIFPGVTNAVTTAPVSLQSQYNSGVQTVTSCYRSTEQPVGGRSDTVTYMATTSSAVNSSANVKQLASLKQPLQSINLADLLDYSFLLDHGLTEGAGTVDLRNPTVLANMLQSLNSAGLPSNGGADQLGAETSQYSSGQQFTIAKQAGQTGLQSFQEVASAVPVQHHIALSNQQQSRASQYSSHATVASTGSTPSQTALQKTSMPYSGVVWPWGDQALVGDKSQPNGVMVDSVPTSSASSSSVPVLYEAVSPPGGSVDNMSFTLLDNLQFTSDVTGNGGYHLNSLLSSTVDTSALLGATPQNIPYQSQQSSGDTWTPATSALYATGSRLQADLGTNEAPSARVPLPTLDTIVSRQPDREKGQKQKANLGIVLPMTHGSREEGNSTTPQSSSSLCKTATPSDQQGHFLNSQLSAEKPSGPLVDTATGGIVLTNITGNVYVNQYTMLPGGATALDNALLHTDYSSVAATTTASYSTVSEDATYSLVAPPVAVMLNNENELHSFTAESLSNTVNVQQAKTPVPSVGSSHPSLQKSVPPESNFFGSEAAPVLSAKPSNKFESSFLQFICGHKAETLSSVLNSPIKARPMLPKYIPEPRRPKPVEVTVNDNGKTAASSDELSLITTVCTTAHSTVSSASLKSCETSTTTTTSIASTNADWPAVTKLPAKFSHKWKNRASLSSTGSSQTTVAVTCQSLPQGADVVASKSSSGVVDMPTVSAGKTKNQNTKWTVSKKSKCNNSRESGLPVLVLKAVPVVRSSQSSMSVSKQSR